MIKDIEYCVTDIYIDSQRKNPYCNSGQKFNFYINKEIKILLSGFSYYSKLTCLKQKFIRNILKTSL